jgi:hypothetical protein
MGKSMKKKTKKFMKQYEIYYCLYNVFRIAKLTCDFTSIDYNLIRNYYKKEYNNIHYNYITYLQYCIPRCEITNYIYVTYLINQMIIDLEVYRNDYYQFEFNDVPLEDLTVRIDRLLSNRKKLKGVSNHVINIEPYVSTIYKLLSKLLVTYNYDYSDLETFHQLHELYDISNFSDYIEDDYNREILEFWYLIVSTINKVEVCPDFIAKLKGMSRLSHIFYYID